MSDGYTSPIFPSLNVGMVVSISCTDMACLLRFGRGQRKNRGNTLVWRLWVGCAPSSPRYIPSWNRFLSPVPAGRKLSLRHGLLHPRPVKDDRLDFFCHIFQISNLQYFFVVYFTFSFTLVAAASSNMTEPTTRYVKNPSSPRSK